MKNLILTIVTLLFCITINAQEKVVFNVSQNVDINSLDLRVKSEWQGKQMKHSYMFIAPEIQFNENFNNYKLSLGHRWNKFSNIFDIAIIAGAGIVDYSGNRGYMNYSLDGELGIKITDNFYIISSNKFSAFNNLNNINFDSYLGIRFNF